MQHTHVKPDIFGHESDKAKVCTLHIRILNKEEGPGLASVSNSLSYRLLYYTQISSISLDYKLTLFTLYKKQNKKKAQY